PRRYRVVARPGGTPATPSGMLGHYLPAVDKDGTMRGVSTSQPQAQTKPTSPPTGGSPQPRSGAEPRRNPDGAGASPVREGSHLVMVAGGPGGYEAALVASLLGARVTIVERQGIGGSAALTDVVPSKTLIATAEWMTIADSAAELGIGQDGGSGS